MRTKKVQKINLKNTYPCPCCKKGKIAEISLTEAFGCDRCQQIFVIEEGETIKQVASSYAIEGTWKWTGKKWRRARETEWKESNWVVIMCTILGIIFIILAIWR